MFSVFCDVWSCLIIASFSRLFVGLVIEYVETAQLSDVFGQYILTCTVWLATDNILKVQECV